MFRSRWENKRFGEKEAVMSSTIENDGGETVITMTKTDKRTSVICGDVCSASVTAQLNQVLWGEMIVAGISTV